MQKPRGRRAEIEPNKPKVIYIRPPNDVYEKVVKRCELLDVSINVWTLALIEKELETEKKINEDTNVYLHRALLRLGVGGAALGKPRGTLEIPPEKSGKKGF
jgi:hypothetical protein